MRYFRWLGMIFSIVVLVLQAGFAQATPQTGWWWNPAESGRGFFIEMQGDTLFMAAYLYEADGRATWRVSAGTATGPYSYTGRLLAVSGGQTLLGDYQAPTEVDAGEIKLQFADSRHGTLTWPGGSIPIERQVWSADAASFRPNGWWWNPNESGRGFCIEVKGNTLVMAGFMYDDSGNPLWYLSFGPMATPMRYEGALLRFSGGQTMSGPYHEPAYVAVGSVAIDWASLDQATLTLSDEMSATALPVADRQVRKRKTVPIKPQLSKVPTPEWPDIWQGPFAQRTEFRDRPAEVYSILTLTKLSGDATWVENPLAPLEGWRVGAKSYDLRGTLNVEYTMNIDPIVTNPALACVASFGDAVPFKSGDGWLNVEADGSYRGRIARAVQLSFEQTCTECVNGKCFTSVHKFTQGDAIDLAIVGKVSSLNNAITGNEDWHVYLPNTRRDAWWFFEPQR
jgi:hypothetical protein